MPIGNLTAFLQYLMQILFAVLMAVFMFVFVPRAAVSAGRIQEVLETEPIVRRPGRAGPSRRRPTAAAGSSSGTSSSATRAPRSRCCATSRSRPSRARRWPSSAAPAAARRRSINLIPRFYDATARERPHRRRRRSRAGSSGAVGPLGVVPQKAFLFSGTVASNLRFGDADATDDELWRALGIAQGRDFVEEMEGGLEAPITQGGTNVSGGQRQRLAIARALVKERRDLGLRRQLLGAGLRAPTRASAPPSTASSAGRP